jgi:hypothetical protein
MSIDRIVMAFAGTMVLVSVLLGHFVSPWWLLLAAFVGFNLLQASFTGFCPLAMMLKRLGVKPGAAF